MWERFVRLVSEVCATPAAPVAAANASVFRAAPAYFRYRLVLWLLIRLSVLLFIVGPILVFELAVRDAPEIPAAVVTLVHVVEGIAVLLWAGSLPIGYALARLDYEQRWYVVTDRSLRIREGVIIVKDMTLTFANVQNVTVEQGPLQRSFAIADLRVQTAGGGGGHEPGEPSMHTGLLRGLANAAELRELVMARLRIGNDAGLGDPDERGGLPADALAAALADLLTQARALGATARGLSVPGERPVP